MRITRKMHKALHTALCLDDVLYEKHLRNMEELYRESERLIRNRKKINQVIAKNRDGGFTRLNVLDIKISDSGTTIIVEL